MIDTGVLGLPTPPPREPEVVPDATVNVNADGTVSNGGDGAAAVDAEVVREGSWEAGFAPDLGGAAAGDGSDDSAYSPAGFRADADFNVPMKDGEAGELTVRVLCEVVLRKGSRVPWESKLECRYIPPLHARVFEPTDHSVIL